MLNAKKKAKYNESKLCRTMGSGLLIITITLVVSLWFNFDFPLPFFEYVVIGILIITIIMMFILGNTVCRKK